MKSSFKASSDLVSLLKTYFEYEYSNLSNVNISKYVTGQA